MDEGRVLVVGGYGAVGSSIARRLGEILPGRVLVGGRDPGRARPVAGVARALRVDVRDAAGLGRMLERERITAVVMCVEPPDAAVAVGVAVECTSRGVHLVDLGASEGKSSQVEALNVSAATTVLSVGLAPGITNLLARRTSESVGGAEQIDITVMLGAGERHGREAVRWTVQGLATSYAVTPTMVELPGMGRRTAYAFPFSDQYTLRRTLGVERVTTRLCLDSEPLARALFGAARLGAFRAARHELGERLLTGLLHRAHLGGSDAFAVRVDARRGQRRVACGLSGHNQSRITGRVAAQVTDVLLRGALPPGAYHIDQLPELALIPESLVGGGTKLWSFEETA